MALTLTQIAAGTQLTHALEVAARQATAAALEAGRLALRKARVILDALAPLSGEHAAAAEAAVLPEAPGLTTGELRVAVTKAVLRLDPDAVRRRREEAQKDARVEVWTDPDGTATLAGRSLPPAEVLAADKRLCTVAAWWKKQLRAARKQADPDTLLPPRPPRPGPRPPGWPPRTPPAGRRGRPGCPRPPPACSPAPSPGTAPHGGRSPWSPTTAPRWPPAPTAAPPPPPAAGGPSRSPRSR